MSSTTDSGDAKLALEEKTLKEDVRLRERELDLRESEIELRRSESSQGLLHNPAFFALVAAAIGLAGNAFVAFYNATAALNQEAAKAEYARVLEMIKVGDPVQASKNLQMLLETGLYTDRGGKLQAYINSHKGGSGAFLPAPASGSSGPPTEADLASIAHSMETPAASWMAVAKGEIGISEKLGPANNPRIVAYLTASGLKGDDDLPWNGAFVCWTFKQVKMMCPKMPGAAVSWNKWGVPIGVPKLGAVAVFKRPNSLGGAVGFYLSEEQDKVRILSGNVLNQVAVQAVPKSWILGYRWPSADQGEGAVNSTTRKAVQSAPSE